MIIACTIDNHYIRHCAVMLRSLFEVNAEEALHVYVVHSDLNPEQRGVLVSYLGGFLPSVSFLHVSADLLGDVPLHGHLSLATYFRLLFPTILPAGVKRLIFLDSDLTVHDSLRDLWQTPLQGHPLAAVIDRSQDENLERLGLAGGEGFYFNCGVLLIDLEAWRREAVIEKGLAYAIANPEKVIFCDQDVINALFHGRCLPLHPRWNALPHLWGLTPVQQWADQSLGADALAARERPAIVHFAGAGASKPWNHGCTHPLAGRYRQLLTTTPWAAVPLEDQPPPPLTALRQRLVFRAKCLGSRLLRRRHRSA